MDSYKKLKITDYAIKVICLYLISDNRNLTFPVKSDKGKKFNGTKLSPAHTGLSPFTATIWP